MFRVHWGAQSSIFTARPALLRLWECCGGLASCFMQEESWGLKHGHIAAETIAPPHLFSYVQMSFSHSHLWEQRRQVCRDSLSLSGCSTVSTVLISVANDWWQSRDANWQFEVGGLVFVLVVSFPSFLPSLPLSFFYYYSLVCLFIVVGLSCSPGWPCKPRIALNFWYSTLE